MVTIFDFNSYSSNPIVSYCISQHANKQVLTLDDVMPYVEKLKYAKWCYDNKLFVRMTNELRLYLSTLSDDFIYTDADCFVRNIDELKMDHACPCGRYINDGSYFRANKNTEWTKFYIQKYETDDTIGDQGTVYTYRKYPYDIPKQALDFDHYYVSKFYKFKNLFPNRSVIFYTDDLKKAMQFRSGIWLISNKYDTLTTNRIVFHVHDKLPFELFKEQLNYTYGKELKFERI